ESDGISFTSDTDTEIIAQLIAHHLGSGHEEVSATELIEAVTRALPLLKGTYGLAVLSPRCPGVLIGARLGSPLVVGIGQGEHFLASDPGALAGKADRVAYLQDYQVCVLTADDWHLLDHERTRVEAAIHPIEWDSTEADKGVFDHFMLKEIYEQPEALE